MSPEGFSRPKPAKPKKPLNSPGYIRLKPHRAYVNRPIAIIDTFLNKIFTVFFDLVNPDSNVANPKCIIKTKKAEIKIHKLFIVNISKLTSDENPKEDIINTKTINLITISHSHYFILYYLIQ